MWRPEWTSSPALIASRIVARHEAGSLPPVGAIPMSNVSGAGWRTMASASDATIGISRSGRIDETLPPAWVESMTATTSSGP